MKLQKATTFALIAVLELAADPQAQPSVLEIAEKHGISAHHLAKVMRDLGRAGIVDAVRGVGGGYRFIGNPKRLTLMDIIDLFEPARPGMPLRAGLSSFGMGGSNAHLVLEAAPRAPEQDRALPCP